MAQFLGGLAIGLGFGDGFVGAFPAEVV